MKIVYFFLIIAASTAYSGETTKMLRAYNIHAEINPYLRMLKDPGSLKLNFRRKIELQLFEESKTVTSRCEFKSSIGSTGAIRILNAGDYKVSLHYTTISNNQNGVYHSFEWNNYIRKRDDYRRYSSSRNNRLKNLAYREFISFKNKFEEDLERDKQSANFTISIYSQDLQDTSDRVIAKIICTDTLTYHDLASALGDGIIFYVNPEVVIIE